jgi:hypothetical protein
VAREAGKGGRQGREPGEGRQSKGARRGEAEQGRQTREAGKGGCFIISTVKYGQLMQGCDCSADRRLRFNNISNGHIKGVTTEGSM